MVEDNPGQPQRAGSRRLSSSVLVVSSSLLYFLRSIRPRLLSFNLFRESTQPSTDEALGTADTPLCSPLALALQQTSLLTPPEQ
jgi:hypothetical protein